MAPFEIISNAVFSTRPRPFLTEGNRIRCERSACPRNGIADVSWSISREISSGSAEQ